MVFPLDGTSWNKSNMPTRNQSQMGFYDRYKFYHSLGNAPGFINLGLRLFNYYHRANSFMQSPDFCDDKRNPTMRTIELPD